MPMKIRMNTFLGESGETVSRLPSPAREAASSSAAIARFTATH